MLELFRQINQLKERKWNEELVQLQIERNTCSKSSQNIQGSSIDRKNIQIQEQFRWMIAAVENTIFNSNYIGSYIFPLEKSKSKKHAKNSVHSKVGSNDVINSGESNQQD